MNKALEIIKNIHGPKILYMSDDPKEKLSALNRIIWEIENKIEINL